MEKGGILNKIVVDIVSSIFRIGTWIVQKNTVNAGNIDDYAVRSAGRRVNNKALLEPAGACLHHLKHCLAKRIIPKFAHQSHRNIQYLQSDPGVGDGTAGSHQRGTDFIQTSWQKIKMMINLRNDIQANMPCNDNFFFHDFLFLSLLSNGQNSASSLFWHFAKIRAEDKHMPYASQVFRCPAKQSAAGVFDHLQSFPFLITQHFTYQQAAGHAATQAGAQHLFSRLNLQVIRKKIHLKMCFSLPIVAICASADAYRLAVLQRHAEASLR